MNELMKFMINEESTIFDALSKINKTGRQILFTVNKKNHVTGSLTDGDIRRAILKSIHLESKVRLISNKKFIYISSDSYTLAKKEMIKNHVRIVPLLTKDMRLKKIFCYDDFSSDISDCAVLIFAGGMGKRMRPLTLKTPKPLLSIGRNSIIESIIDKFLSEGFNNIFISLNYKSDLIKKRLMKKYKNILDDSSFLIEKKPLGTAGSLLCLKESGFTHIITHNADIITDIDYGMLLGAHRKSKDSATVVLTEHQLKIEYGLANIKQGKITSIREKPTINFFAMSGVNIFRTDALKNLKKNRIDMNELIEYLIEKKKNVGFSIHGGLWYDIGSLENYLKAKEIYGG